MKLQNIQFIEGTKKEKLKGNALYDKDYAHTFTIWKFRTFIFITLSRYHQRRCKQMSVMVDFYFAAKCIKDKKHTPTTGAFKWYTEHSLFFTFQV